MSFGQESATSMSIHSVAPTMMPTDGVDPVRKASDKQAAEPASQLEGRHEEEYVKTKTVRLCALIVNKPKMCFGKFVNM